MKHLQRVHLFARTDEFQRFVDHRTDRNRRAAAGIAVEFGKHYAVEIEPVIELPGGIHRILTGHRIDYEQDFARRNGLFDRSDLLHHLLVDRQTPRRIDDYRIDVIGPRVFNGIFGDLHRILATLFGINLHADLIP